MRGKGSGRRLPTAVPRSLSDASEDGNAMTISDGLLAVDPLALDNRLLKSAMKTQRLPSPSLIFRFVGGAGGASPHRLTAHRGDTVMPRLWMLEFV